MISIYLYSYYTVLPTEIKVVTLTLSKIETNTAIDIIITLILIGIVFDVVL